MGIPVRVSMAVTWAQQRGSVLVRFMIDAARAKSEKYSLENGLATQRRGAQG